MVKKLLFLFFFVGLLAVGCNKVNPANNSTNPTSPSSNPANTLQEVYVNTEYGYSFKYPTGYTLQSSSEVGYPAPVTPNSAEVSLGKEGSKSGIGINTYTDFASPLSEQYITKKYSEEPENISKVVISDIPAFKVTFSDSSTIPFDAYLFQKSEQTVFEIKVPKNDKLSQEILNSFQFTK